MFSCHSIHKYTWSYPGGKILKQTDHILIVKTRHSSIIDVPSFRGALSLSKLAAQKFGMKRYNLEKLNNGESKEQYRVKI
jgi:hypothetical protein